MSWTIVDKFENLDATITNLTGYGMYDDSTCQLSVYYTQTSGVTDGTVLFEIKLPAFRDGEVAYVQQAQPGSFSNSRTGNIAITRANDTIQVIAKAGTPDVSGFGFTVSWPSKA